MPEELDFETFALRRGAALSDRPTPIPTPRALARVPNRTRKQTEKRLAADLADWQARRDRALAEYDALVAAGLIVPPDRISRLRRAAAGHPDNEATQAARRVLAKMGLEIGGG